MEREWRPEPTPEEREALDRALARLLAEGGETRTAWWREGIRESVEPDGDPPSRGEGAS